MSRRNRYSRRRIRGRFSFLYKVLMMVIICCAIAFALALFFKAQNIVVIGNTKYSTEQIVEVAGIEEGDNLFMLNKYAVAEEIIAKLPYIETVQIHRSLPDTLEIVISECETPGYISVGSQCYLFSTNGRIMDIKPLTSCQTYYAVYGITLDAQEIGSYIVSSESSNATNTLLELLNCLKTKNLMDELSYIDLSDSSMIEMGYTDRFAVRLNWNDDYSYRFDYLIAVIEKLESNESGVIDLTQNGKASFIPAK